jgi:hypothetical protein
MTSSHFFIIGAQRSGTTYLYHQLVAHPQIEMAQPIRPEPKFFLRNDLDAYRYDDYLKLFFQADRDVLVRGEKTTSYIEYEQAARAIAEWFPQCKIMIILREPIARAMSNYWFSVNSGLETLSMGEAFRKENERREDYDHTKISASPYAYLQRGHYMDYIDMYRRYFPDEALKVIIHEEFVGNLAAIQALFGWLNVADDFVPDHVDKTQNNSKKVDAPPMDAALRRDLEKPFMASNKRLEDYLGRHIAAWQYQD